MFNKKEKKKIQTVTLKNNWTLQGAIIPEESIIDLTRSLYIIHTTNNNTKTTKNRLLQFKIFMIVNNNITIVYFDNFRDQRVPSLK